MLTQQTHMRRSSFGTIYFLVLVFLALLLSCHVYPQTELFEQSWRWSRFTTESGLPSNQILDLIETEGGTVWVSTPKGIAWFDGYRWVAPVGQNAIFPGHTIAFQDHIGDSIIVQLGFEAFVVSRSMLRQTNIKDVRRLVVLADGRWSIYDGRKFWIIDGQSVSEDSVTNAILKGRQPNYLKGQNNSHWMSTSSQIYTKLTNGWEEILVDTSGSLTVDGLFESSDRTYISIRTPASLKGLWQFCDGNLTKLDQMNAHSMTIGPSNKLMVLRYSGQIELAGANGWDRVNVAELHNRTLNFIRSRSDGDLWIGSDDGLYLFRSADQRWEFIVDTLSSGRNVVNEIVISQDGSIWLGTEDGVKILSRRSASRSVSYVGNRQLGAITGLAEDRLGNMWVTSGNSFSGVYKVSNNVWEHHVTQTNSKKSYIHKIRSDSNGNLWFLGINNNPSIEDSVPALYQLNRTVHLEKWLVSTDRMSPRVYSFVEDRRGSYWFGTLTGISRLRDGTWKHWTNGNGLRTGRIFSMNVDAENKIWFGDEWNGLGYIDSMDNVNYQTPEEGWPQSRVWDIQRSPDNRIWVATDIGLACYSNGTWTTFDKKAGLRYSRLWPVVATDTAIYVGTRGGGLAVLHLPKKINPLPRITLSDPSVEEKSALVAWHALSYWGEIPPEEILTRFRIDSSAWSSWSTSRSCIVNDLAAGDHVVTIQARDMYGNFAGTDVQATFTVLPPLALRPGFYLPLGGISAVCIIITLLFTSKRKKHSQLLRDSELKFRELTEAAFEAIIIHENGTILDVNKSAVALFGFARHELLGTQLSDIIDGVLQAITVGNANPKIDKIVEATGKCSDGNSVPLEIVAKPFPDLSRSLGVVAVRDNSYRKKFEDSILVHQEELRNLTSELAEVDAKQRRQLVSFLHDNVSQSLAFCRVKVESAREVVEEPILAERLDALQKALDTSVEETRMVTFELSPPVLEELGFDAGIEWLVEQMNMRYELQAKLKTDGVTKYMDRDIRIVLFDGIREALINVAKHSMTKCALVELRREGSYMEAKITDSGKGFEIAKMRKPNRVGGFGMLNIQARLHNLGCDMDIYSEVGNGTQITFMAPVHDRQPEPRNQPSSITG